MKPKIDMIEELIEVLRSGKYKKCNGQLHNSETGAYCVLGVARDHFKMPENYNSESYITEELGFNSGLYIENKYAALAGVINGNNYCPENRMNIFEWNDNGATFEQIATMLELKLKDYKKCLAEKTK